MENMGWLFLLLLFCSASKYLLSTYYVTDAVLDTGSVAGNKTKKSPILMELLFWHRETDNKQQ